MCSVEPKNEEGRCHQEVSFFFREGMLGWNAISFLYLSLSMSDFHYHDHLDCSLCRTTFHHRCFRVPLSRHPHPLVYSETGIYYY